MKKIVRSNLGTIYYATILKSGLMSTKDRVDVTTDAINAVANYIGLMDDYENIGIAGFEWPDKHVELVLVDKNKYEIKEREKSENQD